MAHANSLVQDQIAPKKQSDQGLHYLLFQYFKKELHKKQNLGQKVWNKLFEILGHLPDTELDKFASVFQCLSCLSSSCAKFPVMYIDL